VIFDIRSRERTREGSNFDVELLFRKGTKRQFRLLECEGKLLPLSGGVYEEKSHSKECKSILTRGLTGICRKHSSHEERICGNCLIEIRAFASLESSNRAPPCKGEALERMGINSPLPLNVQPSSGLSVIYDCLQCQLSTRFCIRYKLVSSTIGLGAHLVPLAVLLDDEFYRSFGFRAM
jgi:hypothetical protein